MDPNIVAMVSIALYATSEIIGMSPLRSNSTIQLVLQVMMRMFPKK